MTEAFSHHLIYEAVADDELFATLPDRMAQQMQVPAASFFWLYEDETGATATGEIVAGGPIEVSAVYNEVLPHDLWMKHATPDKQRDVPLLMSRYVPADVYANSVMYNDFCRPLGLDRFWCLGLIHDTRGGMATTAFHRGAGQEDFTPRDVAFGRRFGRDLGQLHRIRRELDLNRMHELQASDGSLQEQMPILELDHEQRLVRCNDLAEALIRLHPSIDCLQRDFTLAGPGARRLAAAVAAGTRQERPMAGAVTLRPERAQDGRCFPTLQLNVLPRSLGGRRVMVIISTDDPEALEDALNQPGDGPRLTRREREVLQGLIEGQRRDQLAHALGLSPATVDLHSANARRKLGARTMIEAVAMAVRLNLV